MKYYLNPNSLRPYYTTLGPAAGPAAGPRTCSGSCSDLAPGPWRERVHDDALHKSTAFTFTFFSQILAPTLRYPIKSDAPIIGMEFSR